MRRFCNVVHERSGESAGDELRRDDGERGRDGTAEDVGGGCAGGYVSVHGRVYM